MTDQPGILTKSWYLLGVLIWKKSATLTLQEQAGLIKTEQIKKDVHKEIHSLINLALNKLDETLKTKEKLIKENILKEINEELGKILNPKQE